MDNPIMNRHTVRLMTLFLSSEPERFLVFLEQLGIQRSDGLKMIVSLDAQINQPKKWDQKK